MLQVSETADTDGERKDDVVATRPPLPPPLPQMDNKIAYNTELPRCSSWNWNCAKALFYRPLRPEQYYGLPWALEVGLFGVLAIGSNRINGHISSLWHFCASMFVMSRMNDRNWLGVRGCRGEKKNKSKWNHVSPPRSHRDFLTVSFDDLLST